MHGWGGSKLSFACVAAAIEHNSVCIDFPGFGEEPCPKRAFSVEDYADWLNEKISKEKISGEVILVGHSFGGRVAIVFARKYAEFVEKLVLVDSAGVKPKLKINKVIKSIWFRFCKKCAKIGLYSKTRLAKHGSSDWKNLPENMKGTFVKVIKQDLLPDARMIQAETLLVWGEKDADTPLYMAEKLHGAIRNSKLIVIKNAGHYSYLDDFPQFVNLLNNFLEKE